MSEKIADAKQVQKSRIPLNILLPLADHPDYTFASDPHYFSPVVENIASPLHLPDLKRGIDFFDRALKNKSRILVLGDRDVDGVASTALLGSFLLEQHKNKGNELDLLVSQDGDDYGLTARFLDIIETKKPELVVLLDMGSAHGSEVDRAVESGADVIILDHHAVVGERPSGENVAFINPVVGEEGLEKTATVGLVFKFLLAYGFYHTRDWETAWWILTSGKGSGNVYHLGKHVGFFETEEEARQFCRSEDLSFTILDPGKDPVFRMDPDHESFLQGDPETVGRFLLARQIRSRPRLSRFVTDLADLVAIGLITDMMPLIGETRSIVRLGSGHTCIRSGEERRFRPGLKSLLKALRINMDRIFSRDLGWSVGPTLNAAGRMGKTKLALDLLIENEEDTARALSRELIGLNKDRKERTSRNEKIINAIIQKEEDLQKQPVLLFYHPDLEPGVSGIVATRLAERFERPVVFINPDGKIARGSARSPGGGFNVLELIEEHADRLIQYGGHKEAAGFSIHPENIESFRNALLVSAATSMAKPENRESPPVYHLELEPSHLSWSLLDEIHRLEPFGPGNPEPSFLLKSVRLHSITTLGGDGAHAKFKIHGAPAYLEGIAWKMGKRITGDLKKSGGEFLVRDLIGSLELSFFAGRRQLRFRTEAILDKYEGLSELTQL